MFEEMDWFAMADELERSATGLKTAKDLLVVSMNGLFLGNTGLLPYHKQFSAVLDCALEKVIEQIKVIDDVADCLYEINREYKGVQK